MIRIEIPIDSFNFPISCKLIPPDSHYRNLEESFCGFCKKNILDGAIYTYKRGIKVVTFDPEKKELAIQIRKSKKIAEDVLCEKCVQKEPENFQRARDTINVEESIIDNILEHNFFKEEITEIKRKILKELLKAGKVDFFVRILEQENDALTENFLNFLITSTQEDEADYSPLLGIILKKKNYVFLKNLIELLSRENDSQIINDIIGFLKNSQKRKLRKELPHDLKSLVKIKTKNPENEQVLSSSTKSIAIEKQECSLFKKILLKALILAVITSFYLTFIIIGLISPSNKLLDQILSILLPIVILSGLSILISAIILESMETMNDERKFGWKNILNISAHFFANEIFSTIFSFIPVFLGSLFLFPKIDAIKQAAYIAFSVFLGNFFGNILGDGSVVLLKTKYIAKYEEPRFLEDVEGVRDECKKPVGFYGKMFKKNRVPSDDSKSSLSVSKEEEEEDSSLDSSLEFIGKNKEQVSIVDVENGGRINPENLRDYLFQ